MNAFLLDSNILIDYFRGKADATAFVQRYGKGNMFISTAVAMELYKGVLNKA